MSDYTELQAELAAKKAAGWQCTDGLSIDTVLALIAENARLEAINNQMILLECNGGTAQAAINLLNERDKLRAEVAGLRTGYEAYEQVNAELKAENERLDRNRDMWKGQVGRQAEELTTLRKDVDRYQWLRDRDLETVRDGGIFAGMTPENVILNGLDLDQQIDAALGQGEQS